MSSNAVVPGGKGFDAIAHIRSAFEIMAAGAPSVATALVDIAVNGKSEIARVQAAQAVLSRVGLSERIEVGITQTHLFGEQEQGTAGPSAAAIVATRLAELRAQAHANDDDDDNIVDGEVIADVVQLFPNHAVPAPDKE